MEFNFTDYKDFKKLREFNFPDKMQFDFLRKQIFTDLAKNYEIREM